MGGESIASSEAPRGAGGSSGSATPIGGSGSRVAALARPPAGMGTCPSAGGPPPRGACRGADAGGRRPFAAVRSKSRVAHRPPPPSSGAKRHSFRAAGSDDPPAAPRVARGRSRLGASAAPAILCSLMNYIHALTMWPSSRGSSAPRVARGATTERTRPAGQTHSPAHRGRVGGAERGCLAGRTCRRCGGRSGPDPGRILCAGGGRRAAQWSPPLCAFAKATSRPFHSLALFIH